MTPEEKARQIVKDWLDCKSPRSVVQDASQGIQSAISRAVREATAELEAENKRLREALSDVISKVLDQHVLDAHDQRVAEAARAALKGET